MNAAEPLVTLSPHEVLARELIVERACSQHARAAREGRQGRQARLLRHRRTALMLRRLAERLDPAGARVGGRDASRAHRADPAVVAPRAGAPRPWSAAQRAPQRHH